jgi:hypothetical protein
LVHPEIYLRACNASLAAAVTLYWSMIPKRISSGFDPMGGNRFLRLDIWTMIPFNLNRIMV